MANGHSASSDFWDDKQVKHGGSEGILGSDLVKELDRQGDGVKRFIHLSPNYDLHEGANIP